MDVVQRRTERWQARPLVRPQEALALGRARRARYIARVLGHQTLLKRLMCRRGLRRGRTSWQERQAKRTKSDFDLHWTRKLYWRRFYNYYNQRSNSKNFFASRKAA